MNKAHNSTARLLASEYDEQLAVTKAVREKTGEQFSVY